MPKIQWGENLALGIVSIDHQHKKLVGLINDLEDAMRQRKAKEILEDVLDVLEGYIKTHFAYEEKLFDLHNYQDSLVHKNEHRDFESKVSEYAHKIKSGSSVVSIDIHSYLYNWIFKHIKESDQKYKEFMVTHGVR